MTWQVEVKLIAPSGEFVSGKTDLRGFTDDEVTITAGNLAYGLIEESWRLRGEDE